MPKLNQACAFGRQHHNTSACFHITLPKHFSCKISQREPTIFYTYNKLYKSFWLQVILWSDVPVSITVLDVKSVKILQHTFKSPTLFSINRRRNECRSTSVTWPKGSVCCVKNMLSHFGGNFSLDVSDTNYYNKITKPQVCRFRKKPKLWQSK